MTADRGQEMAMLMLAVKPGIQKARECLQTGKKEEMERILWKDVIGLLSYYRDSELTKYDNTPDNLKTSPNAERMLENAALYEKAVNLLRDTKENRLLSIDESTLDAVEGLVDDISNS